MTAKELYQKHKDFEFGHLWNKCVNFEELLGKTIIDIYGAEVGSDAIAIICDDGSRYIMYHDQDCCESVDLDDICGDISCLLNTPITKAEEVVDNTMELVGVEDAGYEPDSYTWTFYHLATIKGYVTIRWYGESNGYYSETVSIVKV